MSASQALSHPWLSSHPSHPSPTNADLSSVIAELRRYNATRKFRKAVLGVLAANRIRSLLRSHHRQHKQQTVVALIMVDLQFDFCDPRGSLYVPGSEEIPRSLRELIRALSARWPKGKFHRFYTMDSHPPNHVSFAANNENAKLFTLHTLRDGTQQMMWPVHCVQRTPGWELYDPLPADKSSVMIPKGTKPHVDSYSGFGSEDGRAEVTELGERLRGAGVTHVVVCGVAYDYCVAFTAKDAARRGYKTCVVKGVTRSVAGESEAWEEGRMREEGVVVVGGVEDAVAFTEGRWEERVGR